MILLTGTDQTLELLTTTTADVHYVISYVDITASGATPGSTQGVITSATTTTILAAPASSTQRQVKFISVTNVHASTANVTTLQKDVASTNYILTPAIDLAAGESLKVDNDGNFQTYTAAGDPSSGSSGTGDALTTDPLSQFAATTSSQLAGVISDETGSGSLVFATSPTLTTPTIGVATATSVNKVAITAPATSSTLTIADGQTLTVNGSATITDGTHSGTNTGDQTNISGNAATVTTNANLTGDVTSVGNATTLSAVLVKKLITATSTGVVSGGVLSIGSPTTKFTISDGNGVVVDNTVNPPTNTVVTWSSQTNLTPTYLATNLVSFIGINSSGTVVQSATPFTNIERRSIINLGSIIHVNLTNLDAVNNFQQVAISPLNQLTDLTTSIGTFNKAGNIFSANGANLLLNKSIGYLYSVGSNWDIDDEDPNVRTLAALTGLTFQYRFSTGTNGATGTAIDPDIYDVSGVSTAVPTNKFTIQRIFSFTSNNVKIQPGQTLYNSLADARADIQTQTFTTEPSIAANGLLRGLLIVKQGTTDLTDTAKAFFYSAPKFGDVSGVGGQSVSTLQGAYNNSDSPEILTSTTNGAVSIKRGSAADTDIIFEGLNAAGSTTFSVTGAGAVAASGAITGSNLSGSNTGDQTTVSGNSGSTDALKSATTTIDVSAATAPSSGQVLTATSGTAATWQTPGGSSPASVSDAANTSTGYFDIPSGTTAQRPGSPATGMVRYNTTLSQYECYNGAYWATFTIVVPTYSADYLVVAGGGGGGGYYSGGGGGAGGLKTATVSLTPGEVYTITVGGGGTAGGTAATTTATAGGDSVLSGFGITTVTSTGGGGGGNGGAAPTQGERDGDAGGSGGGGGGGGAQSAAGTGTGGQGYDGGIGQTAANYRAGGGGGSSAVGATGTASGDGGAGTSSSITGSAVTYAGGGGGGLQAGSGAGTGGAGGGGAGGSNAIGTAGTANTGGGGGGTGGAVTLGGNGGSGVVILSMLTTDYTATTTGSPSVSTSGSYTILTYNSSGTYTA